MEKIKFNLSIIITTLMIFLLKKKSIILNKFLKVAKFNQKKWLKPVVDVYHVAFNYSEIICGKDFNFMCRILIRR